MRLAPTHSLRRGRCRGPASVDRSCEDHGTGRYGRMIGQCYVLGEDIEAWMVLSYRGAVQTE